MRGSSFLSLRVACGLALLWAPAAYAMRLIESRSLNSCLENSEFTASKFHVSFTPENRSVSVNVIGVSSISGNITAKVEVFAYGYLAVEQTVDPCGLNLEGICPMNRGRIDLNTNFREIGDDVIAKIPGLAYTVPDLDGIVRVYIHMKDTDKRVACVQAHLSNAKTVYQPGVGWTTAVVAGIGLIASAITSGLGHSNTAAHIAANALSLFGYFQAQAMIGMATVDLPPVVQAWTQNFGWSLGIMEVDFMQDIFTWYQRSTGGTPSTLLNNLRTTSVEIHKMRKRSLETSHRLFMRAYEHLMRRTNSAEDMKELTKTVIVRGTKRVAFRADIEETNVFMTGLTFFIIFVLFVMLLVAAFKAICELSVRAGWLQSDKFQDFRNGWRTVLKGILFRLTLIGYPQICILCLWEFTERDSPAEVVLALAFLVGMTGTLSWAALKVIRIAKRSVRMHKNPAYILYSDPAALNKWGFLYVQFRATAYYFIVPILAYTFFKAMCISLGQRNGVAQAVCLLLIETALLVAACVFRPWMDKKTNIFNISIAAINFLNSIFILVFSNVFKQADIVTGVMGVVYFVINAAFALVLLVLVLVASLYAIFSKNPETRYLPMQDDRASFTKSKSQLNTELDALGATARGDGQALPRTRDLDDDGGSLYSSPSVNRHHPEGNGGPQTMVAASNPPMTQREQTYSGVEPSVPLFPSNGGARHEIPSHHSESRRQMYSGYNGSSQPGSSQPFLPSGPATASHGARGFESPSYAGSASGSGSPLSTIVSHRQQSNRSPWQRGAGYDN